MREEYDFSDARASAYAKQLKKSIIIRRDERTIEYFRWLASELEVPYQTLIDLYLRVLRGSAGALI